METRFGGEAHNLYGMELPTVGKKSPEWHLNDWKWDGDLFIASPLNPVAPRAMGGELFPLAAGVLETGNSSNSSSSCSDEVNVGVESGRKELDKKRRVIVIDDSLNELEVGSLGLKLGGHGYPIREREVENWEGSNGKKSKLASAGVSRAVCQVEGCGADLSNAKDYHRRHKVCELHSKATKALVGNVMQRFCQQCSRFHVLQEFDDGKRSCRRRLAGHNKRRRKMNPDPVANGSPLKDDQTNGYLLLSLLRILSNMHSNRSEQTTDKDLLSHLLRSLAGNPVEHGGKNILGLLQEPRDSLNNGVSFGNFQPVLHAREADGSNGKTTSSMKPHIPNCYPPYSKVRDSTGQAKINNFDLNDVYIDSDDGTEDLERSPLPATLGTTALDCPSWEHQVSLQSSPPQASGNSDSASAQSPSSSSGDAQSRTGRIVFKLFGKAPNDFPLVLRAQILDWLSHSPTDIESYIRPGCTILTIYLHQAEATWEELRSDLSSSLRRLLDISDDAFWHAGWVYVRVQHQIAFIYNGQVVVDSSLPLRCNNYSTILSVKPIAISTSQRVQFSIKGINLSRPASRLLCAVEGNYLVPENSDVVMDIVDCFKDHDELQCTRFTCSIPGVNGRGFIEVEDHGFSCSFFPFLIAEEDVCSEIRMLENTLEFPETHPDVAQTGKLEAKNQAMDFIHEMGWLLHRSQLKSRLANLDPSTDLFSLSRFKSLMEFSIDHEWCAVVKKLLNILLSGIVGTGEHSSLHQAVAEMAVLHKAVRRNSRPLVELLLRYVPDKPVTENKALVGENPARILFRPDVMGPGGLTPLHIAAGKHGSEDVLEALTDDSQMVGIEAWKNARDNTGFTPEDYARLRGHYSYIHLIQKKINKRQAGGHAVLDIPTTHTDCGSSIDKNNEGLTRNFEIGQTALRPPTNLHCKLCTGKLTYGTTSSSLLYRPAMLSMVAIAAVCVCVALLFKSSPEVVYVFRPFRWESLDYGAS